MLHEIWVCRVFGMKALLDCPSLKLYVSINQVAPTEETTHKLAWSIHYKVCFLNHDTFVFKIGDRNPLLQKSRDRNLLLLLLQGPNV